MRLQVLLITVESKPDRTGRTSAGHISRLFKECGRAELALVQCNSIQRGSRRSFFLLGSEFFQLTLSLDAHFELPLDSGLLRLQIS